MSLSIITPFGAISDGLNIMTNANRQIDFIRNSFSVMVLLSHLENNSLNGSVGMTFDFFLKVIVVDFMRLVINCLIAKSFVRSGNADA